MLPQMEDPLLPIGENILPSSLPHPPCRFLTALTYASYCPHSGIFCLEKRQ